MKKFHRDIQKLVGRSLAIEYGGKHYYTRVSGKRIIIAGTPSCPHAAKNVARDILDAEQTSG